MTSCQSERQAKQPSVTYEVPHTLMDTSVWAGSELQLELQLLEEQKRTEVLFRLIILVGEEKRTNNAFDSLIILFSLKLAQMFLLPTRRLACLLLTSDRSRVKHRLNYT